MLLLVQGMLDYLSLMPHFNVTKDVVSDGRMLMIRSIWTGTNQPVLVPVTTGPGGLAPPSAQEGRLSFTLPHCKSSIDGIADGRMLMIRSLLAGDNQPLPVIRGPGGLAPPSAQEGRFSFTCATL